MATDEIMVLTRDLVTETSGQKEIVDKPTHDGWATLWGAYSKAGDSKYLRCWELGLLVPLGRSGDLRRVVMQSATEASTAAPELIETVLTVMVRRWVIGDGQYVDASTIGLTVNLPSVGWFLLSAFGAETMYSGPGRGKGVVLTHGEGPLDQVESWFDGVVDRRA